MRKNSYHRENVCLDFWNEHLPSKLSDKQEQEMAESEILNNNQHEKQVYDKTVTKPKSKDSNKEEYNRITKTNNLWPR
jgi:hypothetical protein